MTDATFTAQRATGFQGHLDAALQTLRLRYESYKSYRETVRELSALSGRELADLGILPSDIRRLARESAARR